MELKTYRAHSMADALSEVKKDLGKDAVILHARSFKIGGVMGVGARTMVEITASSDQRAPGPRARGNERPSSIGTSVAGATRAVLSREPTLAKSAVAIPAVARAYAVPELTAQPAATGAGSDVEPLRGRGVEALRGRSEVASRPGFAPEPVRQQELPRTRVTMNPVDEPARASLEAELASIKRLVGEVLEISKRGPGNEVRDGREGVSGAPLDGPLGAAVRSLRRHGVAEVWIDELIERVRSDGGGGGSEADISRVIRGVLGSMVPITTVSDELSGRRGRPLVIALVGPTGVGKTTTIAKLAADLSLRKGKRVALIAADTYRIAAVEQIKTYAGIIGLPVEVVHGSEEMAEAMDRTREFDVVLVDTAGRSQRDTGRLDELAEVLAAAEPDRVHLVLAATTAEPVILEAAAAFNVLRPTSVAFTKLDEAVLLGSLVNVPRSLGMGVTYLTNGQDVPDHIEIASGERIATLLLGHERRGVVEAGGRAG